MIPCPHWRPATAAATLLFCFAACTSDSDSRVEIDGAAVSGGAAPFHYYREYIFVGAGDEDPMVVPLTFRSVDDGDSLQRSAYGWLARGATWDRFLDEWGRTSRAGGVWRVVPQGDLKVLAGGAAELESLRFEQGERRLRLDFEAPLIEWEQGGDTRFRLLAGQLAVGAETASGPVLEVLRVERILDDGWPPGEDFDALFLTSGDSIQLVLAEGVGATDSTAAHGWIRVPNAELALNDADIRWVEMRPLEEARRDIPWRWSFRTPGMSIEGELEAQGYDALLGPERGGRRAIEIRYTVEGALRINNEPVDVVGMIRHTQR